jgi:hypothetical protein
MNLVKSYRWKYEDHLQSSWTHLITPSWNFVEVQWQSLFQSTSLSKQCTSYYAPPTPWKRDADCQSLQNFFMVGKAQKLQAARSELNSVFRLKKVDWWNPIRTAAIQSRSQPMWFLGSFNHEKGALRQEISKWSMVCSTFSRTRWDIVRSASLAKGGTLRKRLSPHLHKVLTQSNKVGPWTLQMALVYGPQRLKCGGEGQYPVLNILSFQESQSSLQEWL